MYIIAGNYPAFRGFLLNNKLVENKDAIYVDHDRKVMGIAMDSRILVLGAGVEHWFTDREAKQYALLYCTARGFEIEYIAGPHPIRTPTKAPENANLKLFEIINAQCPYEDALECYKAFLVENAQVNWRTKIQTTPYLVLCHPKNREPHSIHRITDKAPVSGWKLLKNQLHVSDWYVHRLDDPEVRWQYSRRLAGAIIMAPMYAFWRALGRKTGNKKLEDRGNTFAIPVAERVSSVEIHLRPWRWGYQDKPLLASLGRRATLAYVEIYNHYDAESDTLYIHQGG